MEEATTTCSYGGRVNALGTTPTSAGNPFAFSTSTCVTTKQIISLPVEQIIGTVSIPFLTTFLVVIMFFIILNFWINLFKQIV